MEENKIYLHLAIAKSGFTSRRKAEKLIRAGQVKINQRVILKPEYLVIPGKDDIWINNCKIEFKEEKVYCLLNKPKGVLSAVSDARGQKTVIDLLPSSVKERVYPVGRLDKDTTGILILTNDGELAFRLTHPNFKVTKTYAVVCKEHLSKEELLKLETGLDIDGKKTLPAKISRYVFNKQKNTSSLLIEIYEGRKRQIKKMFSKIGHSVLELDRIKYAGLALLNLKRGEMRFLTPAEIRHLR